MSFTLTGFVIASGGTERGNLIKKLKHNDEIASFLAMTAATLHVKGLIVV
jgi:hypothetical protein